MATSQGLSPPRSSAFDWNLFEANEDTDLAQSAEQRSVALIAQGLLDRLDELSEDELDERSEVGSTASHEPTGAVYDENDSSNMPEQPQKHSQFVNPQDTSHNW
ncbi:hypothetical protein L208DRAFT_1417052, partial [Tricholoma matsutake]